MRAMTLADDTHTCNSRFPRGLLPFRPASVDRPSDFRVAAVLSSVIAGASVDVDVDMRRRERAGLEG